ncbi:MAG: hypothetical protein ACI36X_05320 [Bacteroidaceae bacterium]
MLLPTVAMFLAYVWCYFGSFEKLAYCAMGEYKWGYWFTFALTLMAVLHWLVSTVAGRAGKYQTWTVVLGLIGVSVLLIGVRVWDWQQNEARLSRWISLRLITMYFPFYVAGIMAKAKLGYFHRLIENEWISAMALVLFMALVMKSGMGFYSGMALGALGVFSLYRVVYFYRDMFSEQTMVGRQLALIGRHTLSIYLIHYFLFLGLKLPEVGAWVGNGHRWVLSSLLALGITLLIVYVCIVVERLLAVVRPLHRLLLGK